ncbi:aldolase [Ramlibacter henchirensis]|uniref:Aldolase n=1 Tax=Ramlibacter henchirensis TaxID=204072 RepID=A0A4Z0BUD4_9BURK|nr:aldolase/citrate lyase family protein [Ramlibacter henchirensis]TFZ02913.1 aldolase [Ramlibacter henchirensis]
MSAEGFRSRLLARLPTVGTFVKTPAHAVVEVLGKTGLDFVALDAEHAPFDRAQLDVCVMAGRAAGLGVVVRLPNTLAHTIQDVLDLGANGIIVPHITDADTITAVRHASTYGGSRGYSNSPRAGGYGTRPMPQLLAEADAAIAIIGQIEDAAAVDAFEQTVSHPGADAFLIGRADLAVSYGCTSIDAAPVRAAVARVARLCAEARKPLGIFVTDPSECSTFMGEGISFFIVGSDQSAVLKYFRDTVAHFPAR